jgi:hypothetical protein
VNSGWPFFTGSPTAFTCRRSIQPSKRGATTTWLRSSISIAAAGAHRRIHRAQLNRGGLHAQGLDARRADHHRAAVVRLVVGIDRDVVHAHRILLRHGRGVGQAHRVAVVEDLAFAVGRGCAIALRLAFGDQRNWISSILQVRNPVPRTYGNRHAHSDRRHSNG